MKRKKYIPSEMDIVEFDVDDVIDISNDTGGEDGEEDV